MIRLWKSCAVLALGLVGLGSLHAGTATGISGLYYTGVNDSGGLLGATAQDSHWTVTYAYANGSSSNSTYMGKAYVVSSSYVTSNWTPNTSTAQWIVPPGASTSQNGGGLNGGGFYLPGNGTSTSWNGSMASYVYTLNFYIAGTGSGAVTNQVSISLTLAADDQATVYVNPTLNSNHSVNSASKAGATLDSAWKNTTPVTLQNYGSNANANFVIGWNTLVIQVDNTNSISGWSNSNSLNPSGLLVYQTGAMAVIDGKPVPETGTWLIVGLAFALVVWRRQKSRRPAEKPVSVA